MRYGKLILVFTLAVGLSLSASLAILSSVQADSAEAVILFFWGDGCPHCAAEKPFLEELKQQNPGLEVKDFEVYNSEENRDFLFAVGKAMGFEVSGVPVTIIGDQHWIGFGEGTKAELSQAVALCLQNGCPDPTRQLGISNPAEENVNRQIPVIIWWLAGGLALVAVMYLVGSSKKPKTDKRKK